MKTLLKHTALYSALGLLALTPAYAQQTQSRQATQPAPTARPLPAFTHMNTVPQDLARVDAALNNTESFQGRFAQYGSDGSFSQGQIYIKRPGKIRFEYDAPAPLLIVSDGVTLTQVDRALETKDRIPLKSTPLAFFLAENVNLAEDVEVVGLQKTFNDVRVSARDGSGEVDGVITMVFDPQSLALKEWIIADGFGATTRVALSDIQYNQRLNPRLFVLRDDKRNQPRR